MRFATSGGCSPGAASPRAANRAGMHTLLAPAEMPLDIFEFEYIFRGMRFALSRIQMEIKYLG
jgi:hypothetical protein